MFFRKPHRKEPKLVDIVPKKTKTDFLFWNAIDDLGAACEVIQKKSQLAFMAYAYARRDAAAALHVQGLMDSAGFSHAEKMFKGIQAITGHTKDFQEKAAAEALEFLQSYSTEVTPEFASSTLRIARDYDIADGRLSDAQLFEVVTEFIEDEIREQAAEIVEQSGLFSAFGLHDQLARLEEPSASLDAAKKAYRDKITLQLQELSQGSQNKTVTLMLSSLWKNQANFDFREHFSCELHFGDDELSEAKELISELEDLYGGWLSVVPVPFRGENSRFDSIPDFDDDDIPF